MAGIGRMTADILAIILAFAVPLACAVAFETWWK